MSRKYPVDDEFFKNIDTEDKAYFLGLLYADGNVYENYIKLNLSNIDKDIIEKFRDKISPTRPIQILKSKTLNRQDQSILVLSSKIIADDLNKLGCMPNKTFQLKFPTEDQVPSNLIKHFIRGYFDGDGSMSKYQVNNKPCWKFITCIVSTKEFCESLVEYLKLTLGINSCLNIRHKERNNNTRQLFISGTNQVQKFLDFIYKDASIYMNRKYINYRDNFKDFKALPPSGCCGVCYGKKSKSWLATIYVDKKKYYLGSFKNKDDAIKVVTEKRLELAEKKV